MTEIKFTVRENVYEKVYYTLMRAKASFVPWMCKHPIMFVGKKPVHLQHCRLNCKMGLKREKKTYILALYCSRTLCTANDTRIKKKLSSLIIYLYFLTKITHITCLNRMSSTTCLNLK